MAAKRKIIPGGGFLTERQVQVLTLRSEKRTQEEVSKELGISRQDVSVLERRALKNIERAADTLQMAENIGLLKRIRIAAGSHLLDIAKDIIQFADSEGISISSSIPGIMAIIQSAASGHIEKGTVVMPMDAIIMPDGRVNIKLS